ncbi:hypothetical protein O6H91_10G109300 [Diphasiastrum complanatum]|uniref:Uncharacterized protein n=1 Tax=Diphasiastrum complanatum TaxID=34168 RepID=A0ACC2CKN7_DIPCM|nr:hypothetical protein O6H91_10G109300 [Diphasiastrum complanatum]
MLCAGASASLVFASSCCSSPRCLVNRCSNKTSMDDAACCSKSVVDRVVIVGGGLGGLSAAIQLRKRGIDAQIYEKNESISGGEGTLISLFPNGCRALNDADPSVVQKLRAAGVANMKSSVLTPEGNKIGEWSLSRHMEETYGQPMVAILWRNALNILSEAVPKDCKHTNFECYDITQDEDGTCVHFKKESETIVIKCRDMQAPLVIGADGIHSVVRSSLFGPIKPRDNGRTMWRAVIESNLCTHKLLDTGTIATTANGRTLFVVNGVHGKLYWAFSLTDESSDGRAKLRSKSPLEMKERLLEEFKDWELATHILQATDPNLILERRVLDMPVLHQWTKGNCTLLGDAAHAVTPALGQGANLAFEDGCELAFQLSSSPDLRTALGRYEDGRRARAIRVAEQSQSSVGNRSQDFYDWLYTYNPSDLHERMISHHLS